MKGITIQNMSNILAAANKENLNSYNHNHRIFGAIEGILLCYGKLEPGVPCKFKEYEVEVTGWFGKKKVETWTQTYRQLMVQMLTDLIDEEVKKLKQKEDDTNLPDTGRKDLP